MIGIVMNGLAWQSQSAAAFLSVLMLVMAGTGAMAQNPPPARTPPRPAAPAPAAPVAPAPPTPATPSVQAPAAPAQPQAEAAPPPEPTRREILRFENWIVTCDEFAEGPRTRSCSAVTQAFNQNKQLVFQWTVTMDKDKQLMAVMQTATGVSIPPGVELRLGKSAPHKIPYVACESGGCVARSNIDANLLRDLTGSPTAEVVIQGSQGNTVQFPVGMKGFERAYAVLTRP
jgi:invasion protein IalB